MKNRLLDIFNKVFESSKVDEKVSKKNLSEWDSLKHINLIVEIESEFDISIEPDEIEEIVDFKSAEKIILQKLNR